MWPLSLEIAKQIQLQDRKSNKKYNCVTCNERKVHDNKYVTYLYTTAHSSFRA